jgi:hypothetical protein
MNQDHRRGKTGCTAASPVSALPSASGSGPPAPHAVEEHSVGAEGRRSIAAPLFKPAPARLGVRAHQAAAACGGEPVLPSGQAEVDADPLHHCAQKPGLVLDALKRQASHRMLIHRRPSGSLQAANFAHFLPACFELDQSPLRSQARLGLAAACSCWRSWAGRCGGRNVL